MENKKTSFRIPGEVSEALARLAEKRHNGSKTDALLEAVRRYDRAIFGEWVGYVQVKPGGKVRCGGCNNPIENMGWARLESDGSIDTRLLCGKCAK